MGRNAFAKDTDINVSVVALAYKIFGIWTVPRTFPR